MTKLTGIITGKFSETAMDSTELLPESIHVVTPEPVIEGIVSKRFGINDLWKIHKAKRYANVYPRR